MKYVFLHGLGQTPSSWDQTVSQMDPSFEVDCPDPFSWLHGVEPSFSNLYKAFESYCAQFHEPLHLCGLSLGGIMAMQYAIEHPQKIASLVLIGTQVSMPKNLLKIQNVLFRFLPNSAFHSIGIPKNSVIRLCKSMMNLDFQEDLTKITCPVLILCGEKDKANQPAALQLHAQISNSKLSFIPHSGHEVNVDNPVTLGNELNTFFQSNI